MRETCKDLSRAPSPCWICLELLSSTPMLVSFGLCGALPKIHPDTATRTPAKALENRNDVGKGVSLRKDMLGIRWVCVMNKGCSKCVRKRSRGARAALQRWWHKQGCRTAWNESLGDHCWVMLCAGHSNSASYFGVLVCETSIFHINS